MIYCPYCKAILAYNFNSDFTTSLLCPNCEFSEHLDEEDFEEILYLIHGKDSFLNATKGKGCVPNANTSVDTYAIQR